MQTVRKFDIQNGQLRSFVLLGQSLPPTWRFISMSLTVDLFAGTYFYLSFLEFFLAPQSEGWDLLTSTILWDRQDKRPGALFRGEVSTEPRSCSAVLWSGAGCPECSVASIPLAFSSSASGSSLNNPDTYLQIINCVSLPASPSSRLLFVSHTHVHKYTSYSSPTEAW